MLHRVVQLLDFLLLRRELAFDAHLLLLQNHLAVLLIIDASLEPVGVRRYRQQLRLLLNPILLHVCAVFRQISDSLLHVLQLSLLRSRDVGLAGLGLQLGPLFVVLAVQTVHVELFFLDLMVPLSDLLLVLLDKALPLGQIVGQLSVAVLEHLVVGLRVQTVHGDSRDLIVQILRVDLFLRHLLVDLLHPFLAVGRHAFASRLLARLVVDLAHEHRDLARDILDVPLVDVNGVRMFLDLRLQLRRLVHMAIHGLLHHIKCIHQLLAILLDGRHLGVEILHLLVVPIPEGAELLVALLLRPDGGLQPPDLVFNGELGFLLLLQRVLDVLQGLVAALHVDQGRSPLLHQLLLLELDRLHLLAGLPQRGHGSLRLLLLSHQLRVEHGLLLGHALQVLVHAINQEVLLVLGFFDLLDVILGLVRCAPRDLDLSLHLLIVLLYLTHRDVELVELILRFR
mmetsp:Transcript_47103/g.143111  ORF Transcript_47103/g.143111 Transcript_47103/m.143111 type:complete len:454 (+) Transcript_47103:1011-2372(+)